MLQLRRILCIVSIIILFAVFYLYAVKNNDKTTIVKSVISIIEIELDSQRTIKYSDVEAFDSVFSLKNKELADNLSMSEEEAFIFGNLGRYWADNILKQRSVKVKNNDLIYYKSSYHSKLMNSPYILKDKKPVNSNAFNKQLNAIRRSKWVLLDLDTDNYYPITRENAEKYRNSIVIKKLHLKKIGLKKSNIKNSFKKTASYIDTVFQFKNNKIIVSDLTVKLAPDVNCSSDICKEILYQINNANSTIDMAIYGYSSTPAIENALKDAVRRGVRVRIIYDVDKKGNNIYPDTFDFIKDFANIMSDIQSPEANYTMHNKFYVFDNKIVITGSANLSHTDMSGFNSNAIIVIKSKDIAQYYRQEFEQMYAGKFHNDKISMPAKESGEIKVFFSPQDKPMKNGILELIKQAHGYIYIPSFVITDKAFTLELMKAKNRGVDVRIIADALNASTKHSRIQELRNAGILSKAENYAGKMHSKTIIIDDEYLVLGSMNFSYSGENKNDENIVIIHNSDAAKFYKKFFLYQWNRIPDKWLKYTPRAEGINSIGSCNDGIDNNYDGHTDMEDEACKKLQ